LDNNLSQLISRGLNVWLKQSLYKKHGLETYFDVIVSDCALIKSFVFGTRIPKSNWMKLGAQSVEKSEIQHLIFLLTF